VLTVQGLHLLKKLNKVEVIRRSIAGSCTHVRAYTLCCCQNHLSPHCDASADNTHITEGGVAPTSVLLHHCHRYPGDWEKQNPLPAFKSALMLILIITIFSKGFSQLLPIQFHAVTNYSYVVVDFPLKVYTSPVSQGIP
jgi:hypothetical protein